VQRPETGEQREVRTQHRVARPPHQTDASRLRDATPTISTAELASRTIMNGMSRSPITPKNATTGSPTSANTNAWHDRASSLPMTIFAGPQARGQQIVEGGTELSSLIAPALRAGVTASR